MEEEAKNVEMDRFDKEEGQLSLQRRVYSFCLKCNTNWAKRGYEKLLQKQPMLAVRHIARRITHPILKNRVFLKMKLRKAELERDFFTFVRILAAEADAIDRQDIT